MVQVPFRVFCTFFLPPTALFFVNLVSHVPIVEKKKTFARKVGRDGLG